MSAATASLLDRRQEAGFPNGQFRLLRFAGYRERLGSAAGANAELAIDLLVQFLKRPECRRRLLFAGGRRLRAFAAGSRLLPRSRERRRGRGGTGSGVALRCRCLAAGRNAPECSGTGRGRIGGHCRRHLRGSRRAGGRNRIGRLGGKLGRVWGPCRQRSRDGNGGLPRQDQSRRMIVRPEQNRGQDRRQDGAETDQQTIWSLLSHPSAHRASRNRRQNALPGPQVCRTCLLAVPSMTTISRKRLEGNAKCVLKRRGRGRLPILETARYRTSPAWSRAPAREAAAAA
jgi:hypothetical protein